MCYAMMRLGFRCATVCIHLIADLLCKAPLAWSHYKADLQVMVVVADHDLTFLIQSVQHCLQLLRAAGVKTLALEILAGNPWVQVPHLQISDCLSYCAALSITSNAMAAYIIQENLPVHGCKRWQTTCPELCSFATSTMHVGLWIDAQQYADWVTVQAALKATKTVFTL